jgi:hypothetical protein
MAHHFAGLIYIAASLCQKRTPFFMINVYKSADEWVEAQSWASVIEKLIHQLTLRIPDLFSFHPTMKDPGLNLEATNRHAETNITVYYQLINIIDR